MKYTKQDFETAISTMEKLDPRGSFWFREDYDAIGQLLETGVLSSLAAEVERDQLIEEVIESVKKLTIKQAGVSLIIRDGLILGISRRHNKTIFGLPGGKWNPLPPDNDKDTKDTAIRETREETSIVVKDCILVYERIELGDGPNGVDYYSRCYYATEWEGDPTNSEEGDVKWLTAEQVTSTMAASAKVATATKAEKSHKKAST